MKNEPLSRTSAECRCMAGVACRSGVPEAARQQQRRLKPCAYRCALATKAVAGPTGLRPVLRASRSPQACSADPSPPCCPGTAGFQRMGRSRVAGCSVRAASVGGDCTPCPRSTDSFRPSLLCSFGHGARTPTGPAGAGPNRGMLPAGAATAATQAQRRARASTSVCPDSSPTPLAFQRPSVLFPVPTKKSGGVCYCLSLVLKR